MAKSLIKTVDGIGIWVRDDAEVRKHKHLISKTFGIIPFHLVVFFFVCILWSVNVHDMILKCVVITVGIIGIINVLIMLYCICEPNLFAYKIYSGSDETGGIFVIKTTPEADQLAICKAAKEIESQCHEIAAKRADLDRIAAGCK